MSHRRNIGSPLVARTAGEGRSAAVMDERADPLARVDEHDRELLERARTALKDLPIGEESIAEIVRAVRAVERRWRNVQQELVETGRWLATMTRHAGERGYKALYEAGIVGIEPARASKLRAIAAAVEAERIPVELLPSRFTVAYYAATLPADTIDAMLAAGVLRPTVRQLDLEAFVRRHDDAAGGMPPAAESQRQRRLLRRLRRLTQTIERAQEEAAEIRQQLGLT
jgi:hypothetical protein